MSRSESFCSRYKVELIDLMERFGLFAPTPNKQDEWLVPTLLREASSAPPGWPSCGADAVQLRIHFSLEGQVTCMHGVTCMHNELHAWCDLHAW